MAKAATRKQDKWKTARIFERELPAMPSGRQPWVRWHYNDIRDLPTFPERPEGAWNEHANPWEPKESVFRGPPMPDSIRMAQVGWPEGAEEARKLHDGIMATEPQRLRLAQWAMAGSVPSVTRALAGNPMHMRRMVRKETAQRPVITLVCDIGVNWNFPASGMIAHAAAVAASVDFLEDAGFRCEILSVTRSVNREMGLEQVIRLKTADQALNLSVVAYGLGHPAFFRRLLFAQCYCEPDAKPVGEGLGAASKCQPDPDKGTFTIGAGVDAGISARAPDRFRHIMRELASQGCPGVPEEYREARLG